MNKVIQVSLFVIAIFAVKASAQPIKLHPANPHYFLYKGQPTILITSAEIYGAVLNLDFNYTRYLNALSDGGANYTRIYPGAYFEPENKWFKNQSLGPSNDALCLPWGRSSVPGYVKGGNKFDLDSWNPAFFERIKSFIRYAGSKGIVVEVCLFNCQKSWTWPIHPLNINCNVNNAGKVTYTEFQTLKEPRLVEYQKKYVHKIISVVNEFDNVIIEIIDEPTITKASGSDASAWISEMIDEVIRTESSMPKKHLIGQQVEGGSVQGPVDFSADPRVPLIIGQYAWKNNNQVGTFRLLDNKYKHAKVIEFNETSVYPLWYGKGSPLIDSRAEAWEFIVGGGGSFNQLNSLYTVGNEDAAGTGNDSILRQLKVLKDFMFSFDFVRMKQDTSFKVEESGPNAFIRGISEPGAQYAYYFHHSKNATDNPDQFLYYQVLPGKYIDKISLNLPRGNYLAYWINPASGEVINASSITHNGGRLSFTSPEFKTDIALKLNKTSSIEDIYAPLIRSNNVSPGGASPEKTKNLLNSLPVIRELPDPFIMNNGSRVHDISDWLKQREELKEKLQFYEYGHFAPPSPVTIVSVSPDSVISVGKEFMKRREIQLKTGPDGRIPFALNLFIPGEGNGPFPVIIDGDMCWGTLLERLKPEGLISLVKRGYIIAEFDRTKFSPDLDVRVKPGLPPDVNFDFGAILDWAWGFHRTVDYFTTLKIIDKTKIGVTGWSRGGKTALLAGAFDERIALVNPNCSGTCGSGPLRFVDTGGETIDAIAKTRFPFWFCSNFQYFLGNNRDKIPVDQHTLIALVAPRAYLCTNGLKDIWANPRGTAQAHLAAREVYAALGAQDKMGIFYNNTGHDHNIDKWVALLDFADQVFFGKKASYDYSLIPFPGLEKAYSWTVPSGLIRK